MIIAPVQTKRLQIPLKELSIGSCIDICEIHPDMHEFGTTKAVEAVVDDDINARELSVQERALIIAQYHAQTYGGDPNFVIGDANFADYLFINDYNHDPVSLGELGGDEWFITPLLGYHSETIERLINQEQLKEERASWYLGAMACMLSTPDKAPLEWGEANDTEADEYVLDAINAFLEYPESAFLELLGMFLDGVKQIDHLFKLDFQDYGLAFKHNAQEGGEAALPPARFHFNSCPSELSIQVFGNSEE